MQKKIQSALISVYYKEGLDKIVQKLQEFDVTIYSTGGTLSFIESLGVPAIAVETLTGFPEILGGRVKTLQPKIFGGILARRNNESDLAQLQTHQIPPIDLVIVDLYPFEETLQSNATEAELIEKIDIGGISLIRATAKNFYDTVIISSRAQYDEFYQLLVSGQGNTNLADRKALATKAFMISSHYDTAIFNWMNETQNEKAFKQSLLASKPLRYGENPHQQAVYYGNLSEQFNVLNGKELSYNNLVDVEASIYLIQEFTEPTVAIMKHTNSCGLASRSSVEEAYAAALAADPVSAFGGVIATNRPINLAAAKLLNELFFEVLTAPAFDEDALELLKSKKNRILLQSKLVSTKQFNKKQQFKSVLGGVLVQDVDNSAEKVENFKTVTTKQPTPSELADLEFAIIAVKHLKSNGIAIIKNRQMIGMGCGQTSRVDALEGALKRAKEFGFDTNGAVMASEAFFPFPDCVNIAHQAGISAIAQPGGSIKDQDSITAANENGQSMIFTSVRHFKH